MNNKKGQGLSTTAIILIVLGVIILAILVVGFLTGWNMFKGIFSPGDNNVEMISQACEMACALNIKYDFCDKIRRLEAEDLPDVDKELGYKDAPCNFFVTTEAYSKYDIKPCASLTCT